MKLLVVLFACTLLFSACKSQDQKYIECLEHYKSTTGVEFFRDNYGTIILMCHDKSNT
jgi:hypothetical protein